jgi:sugar fermentation stimulation protein A
VDRPNRFIVRARVEPEGDLITAHLPDPGRLVDLLVPDSRIFVRPVSAEGRRTEWTALVISTANGVLVSLDTTLPNQLVHAAIDASEIEELDGWTIDRPEYPAGRSRFDFLLKNPVGEQLVLEVKSVTMVQRGVGLFPDAPTERGAKHLEKLIEISQKVGWYGAVLFIVQRVDADQVAAAGGIDPEFARTLQRARKAGVRVLARRCQVTLEEIVLGIGIPVL